MIAYLSGGMENADNEGTNWRAEITTWLKESLDHDVIDPVIESRNLVKYTRLRIIVTGKNQIQTVINHLYD